jgi:hypothetical protein
VVIKGAVEATLYDMDDKEIEKISVGEGGCIVTLHGGHTFRCLEDNTMIAEFKNGPYQGQAKDKVFI